VHPTLLALVKVLIDDLHPPSLRVHGNAEIPDDIPKAGMKPDVVVAHVRDTAPTTLGSVAIGEFKLPGDLEHAVTQVGAYLRRRVFKLCSERDARGEPFHDVFALGFASDGRDVVLVRVNSGAPRGGDFKGYVPCPSLVTDSLELFGRWNFVAAPDFSEDPPIGFCALARLLGPDLARLTHVGAPLEKLDAMFVAPADDDELESPFPVGRPVSLVLGDRLGSGGSSDAYQLVSASDGVTPVHVLGVDANTVIVKVARCATHDIVNGFSAEREALTRLRDQEGIPQLVGVAHRADGGSLQSLSHAAAAPWPLLVLRPRGVPVQAWVRACVEAAFASASAVLAAAPPDTGDWAAATSAGTDGAAVAGASAAVPAAPAAVASAVRRRCASAIVRGVARLLKAAHNERIVHCDVRSSNVIVVDRTPFLVDWGTSRDIGVDVAGCGVPAYSLARVFQQRSCGARPLHDVAAALYLWFSIAFDAECVAPWLSKPHASDGDMYHERKKWIDDRLSDGDPTVSGAAHLLVGVEATDGRTAKSIDDELLTRLQELMDSAAQ
jgi:hypothetical protein